MENVFRLVTLPMWEGLKGEAEKKLLRNEESVSKLVFRTRTPVDPVEVEYFRGFRQGVKYVLEGLPNEIQAEFKRFLAEKESES